MNSEKLKNNFIKKATIIHNDKYDYSDIDYKGGRKKVKIICKKHGEFEQTPEKHLKGRGCSKCFGNYKKTTEEYINEVKKIHGNDYDYSKVKYNGAKLNIKIICPTHGIFHQKAYHHLKGSGCPKCAGKNKTIKEIIKISNEIHGNKYDYSLVDYKNNRDKVKIICHIHGIFEQNISNHIDKRHGCPKCSESHGEKEIRKILEEHNIIFTSQKKFNNCKNKRLLPFDFYLPGYNICIEYQGKQHFESIDYFGGDEKLKYIKKNDKIKKNYCKQNDIKLLYIKYDENIIKKLNNII